MTRDVILQAHTILGILIFVTGLLQIFMKKGGSTHRIIGNVYLYGWLLLLISGAYLGGLLITIIGIFGFYFALTGSRIGHLKNKPLQIFDKIIYSVGGLTAIAMLIYGAKLYLNGNTSWGTIFAVFGVIFALTTVQDIFKYILNKPLRKPGYGKLDWYFEHFTRMFVSFIAAVTAFTSIQNVFKDNTLNFLVPTFIGIIAINVVKRMYKKKLIK